MRNTLLALSLVSLMAGSVPAFAADAADASVSDQSGKTVLEMPAIKTRKKMLFQFGLFGTGFHVGWKKPIPKEEANGKFRGVGSPILFTSVGQHAFGLGTPKKTKIMHDGNKS